MEMKRTTTAYVAMNPHRCMACWECIGKCPKKVIGQTGFLGHRHVIFKNADSCIGCNKCIKTCPHGVFFKTDATTSARTMKMGMAFRIERLLPLAFIATAVTGIGLHIAGHGISHETWHNWSIAHVTASFLWLLSAMAHVKRHKYWYKTFISKRFTGKQLTTFILSIFFLTVTITGILLIAYVKGPNTSIGLWHYKLGILLSVLSMIHIFYRK